MEKKSNVNNDNKMIGIIVIGIVVVIGIVAFLLFTNVKKVKVVNNSDIKDIITNGKTAIVYVGNSDSSKCKDCKSVENQLKKNNINYTLYDVKKSSTKDYETMLQSLSINPKDFGYPAVIYIKNGSTYSDIINISDVKVVDKFVTDYKLKNIK